MAGVCATSFVTRYHALLQISPQSWTQTSIVFFVYYCMYSLEHAPETIFTSPPTQNIPPHHVQELLETPLKGHTCSLILLLVPAVTGGGQSRSADFACRRCLLPPSFFHVCIYVNICEHMCTCMYSWTNVHGRHTRTYIYTHMYTHTHTHCTYTCIHSYAHTYILAYIRTCMHAYIHVFIHSYIHTYIHT